ncbi:hypothetical protein [Rathayibacter iranicus]|uniref:Transcriptional regulator, AbiEi antitoxin, Type IV TA system n=2 Tax=Rathayibacter iranicus TaxID=59737 RepID=A0AAD1AFB0_9MICO|nr:hypothetical protein [Rathayibacter iranicus]AZZ56080.1 hypothetical protein C7V51_09445 [Rathayibacter iranicus]MWV30229.1 hypothetical protein [Rathayibacter iranicus NCPPB 2253 = VKM Ac-1602]PPI59522.1 hypothetical protein C5E08_09365 [Rathayibacter iranicus]PWJ65416.1 Transcriptional regulator, AbiEi antitoxin, Type IV TA system [Rathayibacter iranicus NCPPB 2253 = VKM Ac-1602]
MTQIPELLVARELSRVGSDARRLRPDRSKGRHRRLAPGVFVEARAFGELPDRDQHLLKARAIVRTRGEEAVLALHSAAAVWGLPLLSRSPPQVHLLGAPGVADGVDTIRHRERIRDGDVVEHDGHLVTSLERTVLDLARLASREDAISAIDHSLRKPLGGLAQGDLLERIEDFRGYRGVKQARQLIALGDGAAESTGESVSRLRMSDCGVPTPVLQSTFRDHRGFVGRVDFDWPGCEAVGEFDGLGKYRDPRLLAGADPADAVIREKLREDRLRALGLRVIRWTFADLHGLHTLCALLGSAGLPPTHTGVAASR